MSVMTHAITYFNMTDFIFNVNLTLKMNGNKNIVSYATDHNTFIIQKESKKHVNYQRILQAPRPSVRECGPFGAELGGWSQHCSELSGLDEEREPSFPPPIPPLVWGNLDRRA